MKLNLGSGSLRVEGYRSVDKYHPKADLSVDLHEFPWPWEDNSVDAVAAFHFMEHTHNLDRTLDEVHRILKPGGEFWVKVPHANSIGARARQHFLVLTCCMVNTFGWTEEAWATGAQRFRTTLLRLNFRQKDLYKRINWVMPILQWLANFNVWGWEFLRLPVDEIEWKGVKTYPEATKK